MPLDAPPALTPTLPDPVARRDDDLVGLLAAGQPELAFARLAERYAPKVHRLCLAMLRDPAQAEEAAQDSLLRAWRALPGYRPQSGALSTWLYAITRNRCLTLIERAAPAGGGGPAGAGGGAAARRARPGRWRAPCRPGVSTAPESAAAP